MCDSLVRYRSRQAFCNTPLFLFGTWPILQLRVAINSEIAVRKAVLKFRQSVAHYEEKQTKLLHYNDTLAKSLQHFSGIDGAKSRVTLEYEFLVLTPSQTLRKERRFKR
jgi:hypothetical protein